MLSSHDIGKGCILYDRLLIFEMLYSVMYCGHLCIGLYEWKCCLPGLLAQSQMKDGIVHSSNETRASSDAHSMCVIHNHPIISLLRIPHLYS
jgi:hypothetical protein